MSPSRCPFGPHPTCGLLAVIIVAADVFGSSGACGGGAALLAINFEWFGSLLGPCVHMFGLVKMSC